MSFIKSTRAMGVLAVNAANAVNDKLVRFEHQYALTESKLRVAAIGIYATVMANNAHSQVAATICKVYNGVFSNELISAIAFVVLAILLSVMLLGDGQKEKSGLIKFMVVLAALFNIPTLLGYFGVSPC
jgi:hypothetical protein